MLKNIKTDDTPNADRSKWIVAKDRLDGVKDMLGPVESVGEIKGALMISLLSLPVTDT